MRSEGLAMALLGHLDPQAPPPMAILAGTTVNQDGRSSALTAPNGVAQQVSFKRLAAGYDLVLLDSLGKKSNEKPQLAMICCTQCRL